MSTSNGQSNPLLTFTAREVLERVTSGRTNYRRYFVILANGYAFQVGKEWVVRHFTDMVELEEISNLAEYVLDAFHEPSVGWQLSITALPLPAAEVARILNTVVELAEENGKAGDHPLLSVREYEPTLTDAQVVHNTGANREWRGETDDNQP